jgi:hypothetical protein
MTDEPRESSTRMGEADTVTVRDDFERKPVSTKRSWKSKLIEFALWAALSIVTAIVMIALSNKLLPTNF